MLQALKTLYKDSLSHLCREERMLSEDDYRAYRLAARQVEEQKAALSSRLSEQEQALLERLWETEVTCAYFEGMVCFGEGLAAGVQLGALDG